MTPPRSAVVAGHVCLDIIPSLATFAHGVLAETLHPGRLVQTGPATFATGGPVSNVGLALHRLSVPTRLVAKVGEDAIGRMLKDLIAQRDPLLAEGLRADPEVASSYTIILSPPGVDRTFLHYPGANDTFTAADVPFDSLSEAALFHFGYPTVMRAMYTNNGARWVELMQRAKAVGLTTSVDLTFPDPASEAGRARWRNILSQVLPYVDVFMPSIEEVLFILRRNTYERLNNTRTLMHSLTPESLEELAGELLGMGAKVVGLKLGERGLFVRTGAAAALEAMGRASPAGPAAWANCSVWAACFRVNVTGTTGAGDATIAGFLAALMRGLSLHEAVTAAVAVGACAVEAADATSGVRPWDETHARIAAGWERHELPLTAPRWHWVAEHNLWEKA
jgi:sugar/nucleoside kinase (ribokinase family)